MHTRPVWKPIFTGKAAEEARQSILAVAEDLRDSQWSPERLHHSLAGGSAGVAIYYHELAQQWPHSDFLELRDRYWNEAIDGLARFPSVPNLYTGFTGVGWLSAFLGPYDTGQEREAEDEAHEELEGTLLECLATIQDPANYDLINGPAGWALYSLERWPRPRAARALELIVDFFERRAERVPQGIRWHTPPELLPEWQRENSPLGYYNLGLSHGMPGVWALLSQTTVRGIRPQASEALLEGAIRWGLSQQIETSGSLSFPSTVAENRPAQSSRLAWCYGDLGIAAALFVAGQVTGRTAWTAAALAIARRCAKVKRRQSGVVDPGLCHGAAGIGHIFNRFYQATGVHLFARAARTWLQTAMNMRLDHGGGPGGYAAWRHVPKPGWVPMAGLRDGSAGIALALLAAIGGREPQWDRFLSISPVPLRSTRIGGQ